MLKKKIWASFQRIIGLFTQKFVTKLSKIWVWDQGYEIRDLGKSGSPIWVQGSKRHRIRIPDPDPQHWVLGTENWRPLMYSHNPSVIHGQSTQFDRKKNVIKCFFLNNWESGRTTEAGWAKSLLTDAVAVVLCCCCGMPLFFHSNQQLANLQQEFPYIVGIINHLISRAFIFWEKSEGLVWIWN